MMAKGMFSDVLSAVLHCRREELFIVRDWWCLMAKRDRKRRSRGIRTCRPRGAPCSSQRQIGGFDPLPRFGKMLV